MVPASSNVNPRISTELTFVDIPEILCLLSFFFDRVALVDHRSRRFPLIQMRDRGALVHLTVTGPNRID